MVLERSQTVYQTLLIMEQVIRREAERAERENRRRVGQGRPRRRG
jgi:hypothetical protein